MAKFRVTYKKEYDGKVEILSDEIEAKKSNQAKQTILHNCRRASYEFMEALMKERPEQTFGCGNYGRTEVGEYEVKKSCHPKYSGIRKGKWILKYFDFEAEEIE